MSGAIKVSPGFAAQVMLTSPLAVTGIVLVAFTMVMAWAMLRPLDAAELWERTTAFERHPARVTQVSPAERRKGRVRLWEVEFEASGRKGSSFTSAPRDLKSGDAVEVEYPTGKPERARVAGMRLHKRHALERLGVVAGGLAGLVILAMGTRRGRRVVQILSTGQMTEGQLVERSQTRVSRNRAPVFNHIYKYTAVDGRTAAASAASTDELPEHTDVYYDPETHEAVAFAGLPGRPLPVLPGGELTMTRPTVTGLAALLAAGGLAGWIAVLVRALT